MILRQQNKTKKSVNKETNNPQPIYQPNNQLAIKPPSKWFFKPTSLLVNQPTRQPDSQPASQQETPTSRTLVRKNPYNVGRKKKRSGKVVIRCGGNEPNGSSSEPEYSVFATFLPADSLSALMVTDDFILKQDLSHHPGACRHCGAGASAEAEPVHHLFSFISCLLAATHSASLTHTRTQIHTHSHAHTSLHCGCHQTFSAVFPFLMFTVSTVTLYTQRIRPRFASHRR